jgi:serine/threonine-protein kinase
MGENLDGRADQYALAVTTFELLTGHRPYDHSNPAVVISKHLSGKPPSLTTRRPDLAHLDPVLARALAKDPHDRFARCRDFARALGRPTPADPIRGSSTPHQHETMASARAASTIAAPIALPHSRQAPPARHTGPAAPPKVLNDGIPPELDHIYGRINGWKVLSLISLALVLMVGYSHWGSCLLIGSPDRVTPC